MIKFGISKNYVPNWGIVQAIREVYQNFIDYGEFNVNVDDIGDTDNVAVRISNSFTPESFEFLKIGFSNKSEGSIGGHGEGMKLAGLVFLRNNKKFRIYTSVGRVDAAWYNDDALGECYGMNTSEMTTDKFEVYFECNKNDIEIFTKSTIKSEDVLHKTYCGSIVSKDKGNIYVGGLYVCNMSGLKYAIDFKPNYIRLGRDRDVPSTWDLEHYTNQVINGCQKELSFRASDINNREFYGGDIPSKLAEKFVPSIDKDGDITLKSGKTIVTDHGMVSKLSSNPVVKKRIEKLKYEAVFRTRKSPTTILKEAMSDLQLSQSQRIRFNTIIKLSTNWKNRK